ncbi:MAG: sulfite exporter TauE/SafE family protein [Candidatus Krumholzibacteria bacterium]|nr:sulfite exporter TauE/SafE family protein [Candidatus Krumholzibacteria bacterium]
METIPLWLPPLFFLIALLYATVGFGGGSSYLAVLALIGLPYQAIPQTALVCNLIVSAGGVWHFRRRGHLDLAKILPFVILSIPMAYLGGRLEVGRQFFMMLLGVSLLAAAARTFIPGQRGAATRRSLSVAKAYWVGLPVGGLLGLLAGVVGIGGGIFLAPVLLLSGWADAKQTAATASVFILVNSGAGLVGQVAKGVYLNEMILPLALAVILGGQIGSRVGSYHLPMMGVRRLIATLILLVSLRLIWGAI